MLPKPEYDTEIIPQTDHEENAKVAARRMKQCVMSASEQALYRYAPNEARNNIHPGFPCDDYAE